MCATVRPAAADEVLDGLPGAAVVVGVHRGERLVRGAGAADHGGDLQLGQHVGQRVVGVHRDQQHAVHAVRRQVLGEPLPLPVAAREDQQQLHLGVGQRGADTAEHVGEVGLGEEPGLRLGHHERYRVGAVGREGAGRGVGDVTQLGDGRLDGGAGRLAHPRGAVDHARHGAAADPGARCHLLEGGAATAPAPHSVACHPPPPSSVCHPGLECNSPGSDGDHPRGRPCGPRRSEGAAPRAKLTGR